MEEDEIKYESSTSYSGIGRDHPVPEGSYDQSGHREEGNELHDVAFPNVSVGNQNRVVLTSSKRSEFQQSRLRAPQPQEDEEVGRRNYIGSPICSSDLDAPGTTKEEEARHWHVVGKLAPEVCSRNDDALDDRQRRELLETKDISSTLPEYRGRVMCPTRRVGETSTSTPIKSWRNSKKVNCQDGTEETAELLVPPSRREDDSPVRRRTTRGSDDLQDVMMIERLIQIEENGKNPQDAWKERKMRYHNQFAFDVSETEGILNKARRFRKLVTFFILLLTILIVSVTVRFTFLGSGKVSADEDPLAMADYDSMDQDTSVEARLHPILSLYEGNEDTNVLKDPMSPQSKALQWILDSSTSMVNLEEESSEVVMERFVMAIFYHAMSGELWSTSTGTNPYNFMSSNPICQWNEAGSVSEGDAWSTHGVLCEDGSVVQINFQETRLRGKIPSEIMFLTNLRRLDLRRSQTKSSKLTQHNPNVQGDHEDHDMSQVFLKGSIPKELGRLSNLEDLVLELNGITGTIPTEFGQLSSLRRLGLKDTNVSGIIPSELGKCTSLQHLNLDHNQFVGSLPPELGRLSSLEKMILGFNDMTGSIPSEYGLLQNMTRFNLKENKITGPLPAELSACTSLRYLVVDNNRLIGSLPSEYGSSLTDLEELAVESNELTGTVPSEFGALKKMSYLHLNNNQFTGSLPTELGSCSSLASVRLDHNDFVGRLPNGFGHLDLLSLTIESNRITGLLPTEFGLLTTLHTLNIRDNNFMGTLPSQLGMCRSLTRLWMDRNDFVGPIPTEIASLSHLQYLVLGTNSITGTIPTEFGGLEKLRELNLRENHIAGSLPSEIGRCKSLTHLLLDHNDLGGRLPSQVGRLPFLQNFWINENEFVGSVPFAYRGMSSLNSARMYRNNFTGSSIDSAFCHHGIAWNDLWSDCLGENPAVTCTCCTKCCNSDRCKDYEQSFH